MTAADDVGVGQLQQEAAKYISGPLFNYLPYPPIAYHLVDHLLDRAADRARVGEAGE